VVAAVAKHTPVISSTTLSEDMGGSVVLKAENLQRTGAFKIRGAMNKLATLGDAAAAGVTTGSAGNHAQALAFAAAHYGVPCRIFVPVGAPITKIDAARRFGADVSETGADVAAAVDAALAHAEETAMAFCAPFDDPAVVAGQGTLGLELVDDLDDLACVIVPLGGGGLITGTAIAVKSQRPHVRVIGVQAAVCAPYAGGVVGDGAVFTLADGIAVKRPGVVTGPLVERWVDEIVTVDEDSIADAMVLLMERAKLYVEGAGAVGVAALLVGRGAPERERRHVRGLVRRQRRPGRGAGPDPAPREPRRATPGDHRPDRRPSGQPGEAARRVRPRRRRPDRGRAHSRGPRSPRPRDRHPRHLRGARDRSRRAPGRRRSRRRPRRHPQPTLSPESKCRPRHPRPRLSQRLRGREQARWGRHEGCR
jgi:threonine dehydratase